MNERNHKSITTTAKTIPVSDLLMLVHKYHLQMHKENFFTEKLTGLILFFMVLIGLQTSMITYFGLMSTNVLSPTTQRLFWLT